VKTFSELREKKDPCWKGYTQVGMKKKDGKEVPNCVPSDGVEKAKGYKKESTDLEEKSVSQAQQKMMGMALAYKRGEMPDASPEVKKMANSMSMKDLEDFAKTKHKGLPAKKESVDLDEATDFRKGDTVHQVGSNLKGTVMHKGNRDEIVVKFGTITKSIPASKLRLSESVELDEMDLSKQTSKQLLQFYRKYADKKMGPSDANTVKAVRRELMKRGVSIKEEIDEADSWMKDSGWRKAQKMRKDRYGNTVKDKNVAKHLAKSAQKKTAGMDK